MAPIFSREFCVPANGSNLGDNTTKNFVSGVTVLLALFGRDATNQFLSQSVSMLDWVIFATAPLGIPFAVLAVIRASRMKLLKSMVGLAEDKVSDVEKDLMSSTSEEVSEMWDGEKVIRVVAPSRVSELFFTGLDLHGPPYGIHTAQEAKYRDNILKRRHDWTTDLDWELKLWNKRFRSRTKLMQKPERFYPPNLLMNLGPYRRLSALWAFSICGVILQIAVIIIAALTTFYPLIRTCFHSSTWPFYFFTVGTGLLFPGLVVCAAAIDRASQDVLWKPNSPDLLVIWLQEGSEPDSTPSYVITKRIKNEFVSSHRPHDANPVVRFPPLIILFITGGFLMQAVGLSAMHWPPQLLQFLATIIMFISRSLLRRQDPPDRVKEIRSGCCKDWIAKMCVLGSKQLYQFSPPDDPDITWKLVPLNIDKHDTSFGGCQCAQNLLDIRRFLANVTQDKGQHTTLARNLALAISEVIQNMSRGVNGWAEIDTWTWELEIQVDDQVSETLEPTIDKIDNEWRADEKELEAVISLLLSSNIHRGQTTTPKRSMLWICPSKGTIASDLEKFGNFLALGLYQIPPMDNSEDIKITFETGMIAGVDDKIMEEMCEEDDGETAITTQRIFESRDLRNGSGAALTRVSNTSLGQLYAQQIFISFMWAIGYECKRRKTRKMMNKTALKTLIRKIELAGVGDLEFAKLAVIAPLSYYNLIV